MVYCTIKLLPVRVEFFMNCSCCGSNSAVVFHAEITVLFDIRLQQGCNAVLKFVQIITLFKYVIYAFNALTLLVGQQEGHSACKRT